MLPGEKAPTIKEVAKVAKVNPKYLAQLIIDLCKAQGIDLKGLREKARRNQIGKNKNFGIEKSRLQSKENV